jgi:DNA-directed RNA polymerase subunit H (RpoH/RPB5)
MSPDKCRQEVHKAIKSGRLTRLPCVECGDPVTDAHHPDYAKPLDVVWLCRKHHMALDQRLVYRKRNTTLPWIQFGDSVIVKSTLLQK